LIFSVPLTTKEKTVERAILVDGAVRHLLPPEYHGDRIRGWGGVLAYRNYGLDIIERVRSAGFSDVWFARPKHRLGRWEQMIVVGTA
jgi:hypothetical protein